MIFQTASVSKKLETLKFIELSRLLPPIRFVAIPNFTLFHISLIFKGFSALRKAIYALFTHFCAQTSPNALILRKKQRILHRRVLCRKTIWIMLLYHIAGGFSIHDSCEFFAFLSQKTKAPRVMEHEVLSNLNLSAMIMLPYKYAFLSKNRDTFFTKTIKSRCQSLGLTAGCVLS